MMHDNQLTGEHIYYCDFIILQYHSNLYGVEWFLIRKTVTDIMLYHSTYQPLGEREDFRQATALTESDLKRNDVNSIGFTVCITIRLMLL